IETLVESSMSKVNFTKSFTGQAKDVIRGEDNKCIVSAFENIYNCILPVSLVPYVAVGDLVIVQEISKGVRIIQGSISNVLGGQIHVYDPQTDTIISSVLDVYDEDNGRIVSTILDIE